ncbi:hypothetical protein [Thermomonas sp.]
MAGVKGRSGGPRANSGGARPNSGPKRAPPKIRKGKAFQTDDPVAFMTAVMQDPMADFKDRMAAGLALMKTAKGPATGKKEQQQAAAQALVERDLAPVSAPSRARPKLVAVK